MIVLSLVAPIFILLIFIELLLDRFYFKKYYRLIDLLSNIHSGLGYHVLNQFANVLGVGVYMLVYNHLRWFTVPDNWISNVVLFIAIDFLYYWAHRLSHEINLLWIDHSVHHMGEDYNYSAAIRLRYYQALYTFVFYLPLAFLGFKADIFIIMLAISTLYQFWTHTEMIRTLGFLENIMVTPSHHRVHHGRNIEYIDKNYSGVFIIWDKIFGSFQREVAQPVYGITQPPESFHPLYMQVHVMKSVWKDLRTVKGWKNRLYILVNKPGWLPRQLGGSRKLPEVSADTHRKYDVRMPVVMDMYLLIHSTVLLLGAGVFLLQFARFLSSKNLSGHIGLCQYFFTRRAAQW